LYKRNWIKAWQYQRRKHQSLKAEAEEILPGSCMLHPLISAHDVEQQRGLIMFVVIVAGMTAA
jgi:hypothetical protein